MRVKVVLTSVPTHGFSLNFAFNDSLYMLYTNYEIVFIELDSYE